jgi:OOP family OmpA-OmpF porin
MKIIVASLMVVIAILSLTGYGEGQITPGSRQISPQFGILWTDITEQGFDLKPRSALLGASYVCNITDQIAAEGSFLWSPTGDQNIQAPRETSLGLVDGSVVYHLTKSRFIPYVNGGVGYIKTFSDIEDLGPTEVYYTFGGGFKVMPSDAGGFRFGVKDVIFSLDGDDGTSTTYHNLAGTAAMVFQFGGVPPVDSDGDGVFDKKDDCPDTPLGAVVDMKGCPLDADGDGVFDGIDTCPDTPAGASVDRRGCPIDSDNDGVFDGLDKCPGTPAGAVIDAGGCPTDSDGDGVYDGLDECPDTPAGSKIDKNGCKLTEKEYEFLNTGMLTLEGITFTSGSATIDPASYPVIDEAAEMLVKWQDLQVEIGGYSDSQGAESFNQSLSEKRANSVRDYILKEFPAVTQDKITAVGYGEANPIAPNDTREGRATNRRVEFKVMNPGMLQKVIETP